MGRLGKPKRSRTAGPAPKPALPKAKKAKVEASKRVTVKKSRNVLPELPPVLTSDEEEGEGLLSQGSEPDTEEVDVVGGCGLEGDDSGEQSGGEGDSDYGDEGARVGPRESEKAKTTEDPFATHFEQDLDEGEVEGLEKVLSAPLEYQHSKDEVLRGVSRAQCLPERTPEDLDVKGRPLSELHVRKQLCDLWESAGDDGSTKFTPLQEKLYAIMGSYKDLMFARRTFENGEELRRLYLLHALNHILKTRSKVLKNNSRLAQAAKEGREMEEPRDQGLTRPKVLILVPFREAALRTVNMLIRLFLPKGQGQVTNRKRFTEEYSEEEHIESKIQKPASHEATFTGNIDDCFRLGVALKRNTVRLYAKFYSADLIIASPLGLRTIIGAKGDKKRDYDFLSSLEVIVLDQADVYMMQNWEHVLHLLDHTHLQPRASHDVDFSRVRMWCINGWSKFYRQLLLFCDFETPEMNSILSSKCWNYAGRVKVCETSHAGTISRVSVPLSHVFRRFSCQDHLQLPEARFNFFVNKILPDFTSDLMKRTCIIVHSYLDFVRLCRHMTRQEMEFEQLSENAKAGDISRARTRFFHGKAHFLLYTERLHFFRRFKLRGIRHLVFYSLPTYAEFYPEIVNFLEEMAITESVTCTAVYSQFDSLALCRIVGSRQAYFMTTSMDSTFTI